MPTSNIDHSNVGRENRERRAFLSFLVSTIYNKKEFSMGRVKCGATSLLCVLIPDTSYSTTLETNSGSDAKSGRSRREFAAMGFRLWHKGHRHPFFSMVAYGLIYFHISIFKNSYINFIFFFFWKRWSWGKSNIRIDTS